MMQDFVVTDRGILSDDSSEYADLIQFPVAGQAMVIGYSLPSLNSSDPTLVQLPKPRTSFNSD
jgi:hypothetical protein